MPDEKSVGIVVLGMQVSQVHKWSGQSGVASATNGDDASYFRHFNQSTISFRTVCFKLIQSAPFLSPVLTSFLVSDPRRQTVQFPLVAAMAAYDI
jgi:hypothetical protein